MLDGDLVDTAFSTSQLAEIEKALMRSSSATGAHFTAYVGKLPAKRDSALAIHRELARPDTSVLVAVDPEARVVEVVTGAALRDHLDDQACRLACLTMTSRFTIGDIAAGLRDGIVVLGDHARELRVLHTDLPD
ncbi:MAG: DUF5130 family protein [Candidatus Nanopelagicales bacterium]